ncbi:MAG: thermonuclease family protein [Nitrospinae bacterium]|nr:thermonuclease family protein [Nitrospinota bacterium]
MAMMPASTQALEAACIRAIDGDTIVALVEGVEEHVRIYGVNAPEKWEPLWKEAKNLTSALTSHKTVTLIPKGRDRFGRLLAYVRVDGKTVGLELVARGLARVYSNQYAPDDMDTYKAYQQAQIQAMTETKGIWGGEVLRTANRR